MKKLLVILMSIIVLTGCSKKEDIKNDISFDRVIAYEETTVNIPTEPATITTTTTVAPTTTTTKTTTTKKAEIISGSYTKEQEIYNQLLEYKKQYPTGYAWDNNMFYEWKGGAEYQGGYECAAFAFFLSDKIFGDVPAERRYDLENVKVGDIIRYKDNNHSVIVLTRNGDTITVGEANIEMDGYNYPIVLWGRELSLTDIKGTFTNYVTRY